MKAVKKKGILLALCATFVVACLAMAGCGGGNSAASSSAASDASSDAAAAEYTLIEPGKIIVGSDLDYKPMEYRDGDTATGFGVAMMTEIANRLGLECEFLPPQNFDTLITQVASGAKMDIAVSSITITDERAETVAFSNPYYDSNLAVVVPKDSELKSVDDLSNAVIGVQQGTSGEDWVKENAPDAELAPFTGITEVMAALRTGKVTAAVYDQPVAENLVANEFKDDAKVLDIIATGEQYGIAINKDNTKLVEDINATLAEMEKDGTIDKLKEQYIG
ncbi:MAG: ABC transporter substrate-binding protein [Coriobacteriaceae bacterium]|nr:ABC transporter substrate-binding protein [Coriobacteriaceae bacterium]